MVGLIIATHAGISVELLRAAEMILGPQILAAAVSIDRQDDVDEIRQRLGRAIDEVGAGDGGVLIMTDMFGGTPANIGISFLDPGRLELLTGVNLPMVLKFFSSREDLALGELASLLKGYGQQGISLASDFLPK